MFDESNRNLTPGRRGFLTTAARTVAAARLGLMGGALTSLGDTRPPRADSSAYERHTSFGPLKQIDAGLLNVGYVDAGPANGRAVILLHGWPYDIHSYVDVAPLLAAKGYRVIVPYLRDDATFERTAASFENGAAYAKRFSGKYSHRVLPGIGHSVPQEAPQAFAKAVIDVDSY